MSDDVDKVLSEHADDEVTAARIIESAGGGAEASAHAIHEPDGTDIAANLREEDAVRLLRRAIGNAIDNNAAAHMGGMGAQGGMADFGSAGNLASYDTSKF